MEYRLRQPESLPHPFGVGAQPTMSPIFDAAEIAGPFDGILERGTRESRKVPKVFEQLQSGEVIVEVGLFRHEADAPSHHRIEGIATPHPDSS